MSLSRSFLSDGDSSIKANERTPLFASVAAPAGEPVDAAPQPNDASNREDDDDMPLPLEQVLLLCYTRMVEPIAFFSIFPYINAMIYETGGIQQADVGFYSGLIESLFSATQMCVMIFWGRVGLI